MAFGTWFPPAKSDIHVGQQVVDVVNDEERAFGGVFHHFCFSANVLHQRVDKDQARVSSDVFPVAVGREVAGTDANSERPFCGGSLVRRYPDDKSVQTTERRSDIYRSHHALRRGIETRS